MHDLLDLTTALENAVPILHIANKIPIKYLQVHKKPFFLIFNRAGDGMNGGSTMDKFDGQNILGRLPRLHRQRLELHLGQLLLSFCQHQEKTYDIGPWGER